MTYRYGVAVIGNSKNVAAFHADRRGNYIAHVESMENVGSIYHHAPDTRLYWADSMEAARVLAKELTEHHPQQTFVAFESKEVYSRPPGALTTAEFSDKGLLPK